MREIEEVALAHAPQRDGNWFVSWLCKFVFRVTRSNCYQGLINDNNDGHSKTPSLQLKMLNKQNRTCIMPIEIETVVSLRNS